MLMYGRRLTQYYKNNYPPIKKEKKKAAWMDEPQAGIKIAGRNINNFRYANNTTLMAECEEQLKSLLMKVKEESEKAGLKFSIQNPNIMTSSLITS